MCVSDSTGYHSTLTASASPRHAILNGKDSFLASRQSAFMAPDDGFKSFLAVKCERLAISTHWPIAVVRSPLKALQS
jgi:hypothetical protein